MRNTYFRREVFRKFHKHFICTAFPIGSYKHDPKSSITSKILLSNSFKILTYLLYQEYYSYWKILQTNAKNGWFYEFNAKRNITYKYIYIYQRWLLYTIRIYIPRFPFHYVCTVIVIFSWSCIESWRMIFSPIFPFLS